MTLWCKMRIDPGAQWMTCGGAVPLCVSLGVSTFVVEDCVADSWDGRRVLGMVMEGSANARSLKFLVEDANRVCSVATSRLTVAGVVDVGNLDVIIVVRKVKVVVRDCAEDGLVRGNALVREEGVDHPLRMRKDIGDGRVEMFVTKPRKCAFDGVDATLHRHSM